MTLSADTWLTPPRRKVLVLTANGLTDAEIAKQLFMALDTVKSHQKAIKKWLGAYDRTNAVAIAMVRGLLHPHEIALRPPKLLESA